MINYKLIGKRIKEARTRLGITQEQLAELACISRQYIGMLEQGEKRPTLQTIVSLADALNITVDELLTGNLKYDPSEFLTDIDYVLFDCSTYEKQVLFELLLALKKILRDNETLIRSQDTTYKGEKGKNNVKSNH